MIGEEEEEEEEELGSLEERMCTYDVYRWWFSFTTSYK